MMMGNHFIWSMIDVNFQVFLIVGHSLSHINLSGRSITTCGQARLSNTRVVDIKNWLGHWQVNRSAYEGLSEGFLSRLDGSLTLQQQLVGNKCRKCCCILRELLCNSVPLILCVQYMQQATHRRVANACKTHENSCNWTLTWTKSAVLHMSMYMLSNSRVPFGYDKVWPVKLEGDNFSDLWNVL